MASIAKPVSVGMAFPATGNPDFTSYSIAHGFISYLPQQLPMMKAHVLSFSDAIFILFIRPLEKRLGAFSTSCKDGIKDTVTDGR